MFKYFKTIKELEKKHKILDDTVFNLKLDLLEAKSDVEYLIRQKDELREYIWNIADEFHEYKKLYKKDKETEKKELALLKINGYSINIVKNEFPEIFTILYDNLGKSKNIDDEVKKLIENIFSTKNE